MNKEQLIAVLEEAMKDREEALRKSLDAQCLLVPHFYDGVIHGLRFALAKVRELQEPKGLPVGIEEALNMGDGVYRP